MSADLIQKLQLSVLAANVGNSSVAVDTPQDGHIESIFWNFRGVGMDALNDSWSVELSFGASNTFAVNDSRISIMEWNEVQNILTSGGGLSGITGSAIGIDIPVFAGERIHVHTDVSGGTISIQGTIYLYHRTTGRAPGRRSQRRR